MKYEYGQVTEQVVEKVVTKIADNYPATGTPIKATSKHNDSVIYGETAESMVMPDRLFYYNIPGSHYGNDSLWLVDWDIEILTDEPLAGPDDLDGGEPVD
jgi:hypothetical protein